MNLGVSPSFVVSFKSLFAAVPDSLRELAFSSVAVRFEPGAVTFCAWIDGSESVLRGPSS